MRCCYHCTEMAVLSSAPQDRSASIHSTDTPMSNASNTVQMSPLKKTDNLMSCQHVIRGSSLARQIKQMPVNKG